MTAWLFLHITGSVLFVGNIITAAFWKVRADIEGNPSHIHRTAKNVMLADYVFTLPGLLLLIVSGIVMAGSSGFGFNGMNWLTASLVLFAVTGLIWGSVLIPLQKSMIRHSGHSVECGAVTARSQRCFPSPSFILWCQSHFDKGMLESYSSRIPMQANRKANEP